MEEIKSLPISQLLQAIQPLLRNGDTQSECIEMILDRIRLGIDSVADISLLLNNLAIHATPSNTLSTQIMELCQIIDSPVPVIHILSSLVRWPEDEELLILLYQDLLDSDRKLLIPIVDSLSSLPLSKTSQEELFQVNSILIIQPM